MLALFAIFAIAMLDALLIIRLFDKLCTLAIGETDLVLLVAMRNVVLDLFSALCKNRVYRVAENETEQKFERDERKHVQRLLRIAKEYRQSLVARCKIYAYECADGDVSLLIKVCCDDRKSALRQQ